MKYSPDLAPESFQHQSTRQMKKKGKREAVLRAQIGSQRVSDRKGEEIFLLSISDLHADEYVIFKIKLDCFVMIK